MEGGRARGTNLRRGKLWRGAGGGWARGGGRAMGDCDALGRRQCSSAGLALSGGIGMAKMGFAIAEQATPRLYNDAAS